MGERDDYDHEQEHEHEHEREQRNSIFHTLNGEGSCEMTDRKDQIDMKLKERIEQVGAAGYILLWLLGIPIPILFLFFLLRGCT
jgi:hypothetical protein